MKYKFSVIVIVYVLALSGAVRFLIMPLISNIKLQAYKIQAKSIDRNIEQLRLEKLPETKKEWSEYESQENLLNVILGQSDQVNFIENVEAMAQASGNKIVLKIEDQSKNKAFIASAPHLLEKVAYSDYFTIQISLEGDYDGLVGFLHMFENSQFYANIITISSIKNTLDDNQTNSNPFTGLSSSGAILNQEDDVKESIKTNISAIVYTKKQ